ncbi:hypothetical protein N431DRAFT_530948 [Stipitochalara longipes BDJ]|nr:hypothetical protein N431DRAFT_530948 [Stipitochalara longipes BDJ]
MVLTLKKKDSDESFVSPDARAAEATPAASKTGREMTRKPRAPLPTSGHYAQHQPETHHNKPKSKSKSKPKKEKKKKDGCAIIIEGPETISELANNIGDILQLGNKVLSSLVYFLIPTFNDCLLPNFATYITSRGLHQTSPLLTAASQELLFIQSSIQGSTTLQLQNSRLVPIPLSKCQPKQKKPKAPNPAPQNLTRANLGPKANKSKAATASQPSCSTTQRRNPSESEAGDLTIKDWNCHCKINGVGQVLQQPVYCPIHSPSAIEEKSKGTSNSSKGGEGKEKGKEGKECVVMSTIHST